ncbi:hypothetical protein BU23DRAFT_573324 [Bimuria novae-zelandiae CBS 107.79]|uniref:Uncharacterized protein n=1 Tax=Bimuria novae-zelandiae CBS 107.79 TaxID=1447943 RepID=A0A6A5URG9_9PLEO|nr:hypothetical protein BU23DRAFT_573324 [Bimuria novae-zelandiae CBS 107.79]
MDAMISWEATTSVFQSDYQCSPMNASITLNNTKSFSVMGERRVVPPQAIKILVNGTAKLDTTTLVSDDGCQYQIEISPIAMANRVDSTVWRRAEDRLYDLGSTWSDMDGKNTTQDYVYIPGIYYYTLDQTAGRTSPFLRQNSSATCAGKDVIHLATVLISPDAEELQSNYSQRAWECALEISTAEIPVTFKLSSAGQALAFGRDAFAEKQSIVDDNILSGSDVRSAINEQNVRSEQSIRTAFSGVLDRTNEQAWWVEQSFERTHYSRQTFDYSVVRLFGTMFNRFSIGILS